MVLLRKYRTEDVDSIARHAGNEKVARWMRDSFPHPYTRQDAETFIASCIAREGQGQLVRTIEVDGAAVGSIGVFVGGDVYCKSGELGYWLGEAYWGRGIMTQAVRQIFEEAFKRFQLLRIDAEPFAGNAASRSVLEKAGFTLEGIMRRSVYKNGQVQDSCMYALLNEQ